ncbi:MAG: response regulator [Methanomicrobiales archaeon]|nr:response regulator [Methanomicrobiales archaeon]
MRILLLEDEDITREIYKRNLKPHEVHAFDNGFSGLRFFHQNENNLDLILSDHMMPMLNGLDLFWEVRKKNQSIPFLLLTGSPLFGELQEFQKYGGTLVTKPIGLSRLCNLVNSYDPITK